MKLRVARKILLKAVCSMRGTPGYGRCLGLDSVLAADRRVNKAARKAGVYPRHVLLNQRRRKVPEHDLPFSPSPYAYPHPPRPLWCFVDDDGYHYVTSPKLIPTRHG